jgi:N-acetylmuramoyl-L-alanine amidase
MYQKRKQYRDMRAINRIIIHCSATPEGKDYTVDTIRKWHKQKGYSDIGYHYVIYRDGSIMKGRPLEKIGAHTVGYNTGSIGICYIGGLAKDCKTPKDTRTKEQKESLLKLVHSLKEQFPNSTIHGHNEFAAKACPSFNVQDWYKKEYLPFVESLKKNNNYIYKCNLK